MDVNLLGSPLQVYYECDIPQPGTSYRECVRVQSAVGATLPSLASGAVVVTNLLNGTPASPVFSFAPDPFSDGALMRN